MAATELILEKPEERRLIGVAVKRIEDPPLLKGQGNYVEDIRLPGTAYMAVLRSTYAHARVRRIDLSRAANAPGVLSILTGQEVARVSKPIPPRVHLPGMKTCICYALPVDRVRFVGEPVAALVAETREQAVDALELIDVEYDPLPVVVDAEEALKADAPLLYDEWGDNIMLHHRFEGGDVSKAFAGADYVMKERISSHRYSAVPLETRNYLASYDQSTNFLTLWASTQVPHTLRTILAETLNFPEPMIRVIQPDVGGAFGPKTPSYPEETLVCLFSMRLKRPVRYTEERGESLMAMHQAREQTHHMEVAVKKDGEVLAIKDRVVGNLGIYFPNDGPPSLITAARFVPGCYKIENYSFEVVGVATNKPSYGAYRGFGKDAANFIIERLMDIIARKLKVDPVDLRLRNLIHPEEMPYRSVTGALYDSGDFPESLRKGLEAIRYSEIRDEQERLRKDGRYLGIGISVCLQPCASHFPGSPSMGYDVATVRLAPSGKVTVLAGVTSTGMGHKTVLAQITAQELGVSLDDVFVVEGDTALCPYGYGNWASRSAVVGGSSVLLASRKVRDKISQIASYILGLKREELVLGNGRIHSKNQPSKSLTLKEIAEIAYYMSRPLPLGMEPGLEATVYYMPPAIETIPDEKGRRNAYAAYANATNIAVVEVDPAVGSVTILRYVLVNDCGKVLNPLIVEGQVHGGVAQGLGGVFLEENAYDESGQPLATSLMDYMLPTSMDVPNLEIYHTESPAPQLPLGAKGVGEGGAEGVAATVTNAIEDALSPFKVEIRDLPLTPEKLWRLVKNAKAEACDNK